MPDRSACKACRHKQHSQHHSNHVWYKLYVATLKLLRSIHVPVSVILVQRKKKSCSARDSRDNLLVARVEDPSTSLPLQGSRRSPEAGQLPHCSKAPVSLKDSLAGTSMGISPCLSLQDRSPGLLWMPAQ